MRRTLALVSLVLLSCGAPELAAPRAPAGEGAAAPNVPVSSGSPLSPEGQLSSPHASASPGAWHPDLAQPSMPPYTPSQPLPPGACERCRLQRVAYSTEHGFDEALLCAHEPRSPIKPLNGRGALMRRSVSPCDPSCCDQGPCKDAEGSRSK